MSFCAVAYRRGVRDWLRPLWVLALAMTLCALGFGPGPAFGDDIRSNVEAVYGEADYQTNLPGITEDLPQPEEEIAPPEVPDDNDWLSDGLVLVLKWLSVAAFAAAVVFVVVSAYRTWQNLRLRPRRTDQQTVDVDGATGQRGTSSAVNRLADAEALALQGAYAEAIHTLLLTVVDTMRGRAEQTVAPALTARELVRLVTLDDDRRLDFASLVDSSERGHFGGRPADRPSFDDCHQRARRLVDLMANA